MNIYQKDKSRYITSVLDMKDYNLTTGHFKRHLDNAGITLADYFEKHEGIVRDKCQACGKPTAFFGYHPDNTVKWHSVCGDPACAKVMYSRAHLSRTPENWVKASEKRRQTFKDRPEVLASRTKIIDEANKIVGEDGLTGYERTAKGRKATLLKKYGREDFANWDKSKETWANKPEEDIIAHGKKISDNWAAKPEEQKKAEIDAREKTKLEKYGLPGWKIAFNGSKGRRSAIAEEFCDLIQLQITEKLIFGNKEKSIGNLFYDLTCESMMKIIEFNGDYWHANPKKYGVNETISMKNGRTAQEIWEADAKKIKLAEDAGYEVKVVWESDFKKNPKRVVEECLVWLKQ